MIADATLAGAAPAIVLHAEAVEDADGAVVHLHRQREREGAPGTAQDFAQSGFEAAFLSSGIELAHGDAE